MRFSIFMIVFVFAVLVIIGAVIALVAISVSKKKKNDAYPVLTVHAVLVSNYRREHTTMMPNAGDVTGAHGYTNVSSDRYDLAFRTDAGYMLYFTVYQDVCGSISEGAGGLLTYQGERFFSFAPDVG